MTNEKRTEAVTQTLQRHIKTFSRIEKAFYGAIVITAIIMAVGIIYLQSNSLQVKQEVNQLNSNSITIRKLIYFLFSIVKFCLFIVDFTI